MTLLEFAETLYPNLNDNQKQFIKLYDKEKKEGKKLYVSFPKGNKYSFLKELVEKYENREKNNVCIVIDKFVSELHKSNNELELLHYEIIKKKELENNMIILQGGRCSGKTSELIKHAYASGAGILTYSENMAKVIKNQANDMGMKDVKVFSFNEIKHLKHSSIKKIYIDELPMFLNLITGSHVCLATGDIECFALNDIK